MYLAELSQLCQKTNLGEANVVRLLTEALAANVEAVLADETATVATDTAAGLVFALEP